MSLKLLESLYYCIVSKFFHILALQYMTKNLLGIP